MNDKLVEELLEAAPPKLLQRVTFAMVVSLAAIVSAAAYQSWSWADGISKKSAQHDVDIATLAVATANLKDAVAKQSEEADRRADKSDERAKRMDRLLDYLESQRYNGRVKEGSK